MKSLNIKTVGTTHAWWAVLIAGVLMIISGFAYWFWPEVGYAVSSQIFGWLLIVAGVVQLCVATGRHRVHTWGWWLAGGVIDIFIGFMLVRSVVLSEAVLPYFLAFIFIFWGIEALIGATFRPDVKYKWLGIINGILLCIIGFLFIEGGWVSDMMMVSFLTSIAFIYWGFTLAIASTEMRPVDK